MSAIKAGTLKTSGGSLGPPLADFERLRRECVEVIDADAVASSSGVSRALMGGIGVSEFRGNYTFNRFLPENL